VIISHRHRFIFIKTHKTAGSSLEMALGALCGPGDVISHMEDNLDTGIPRNYLPDSTLGRAYGRSRLLRKLVHRHSPLLGAYFYEHMPAWRVRELVGEQIWGSYFCFCVERNPWDKLVSYYFWKARGQGRQLPPFRDWVMRKPARLPCDARLYFDGEHSLMDRVYEFRQLPAMLEDLRGRLGLALQSPLPREKTGIASDRHHYSHYYDVETRQQVARLFRREIALMGYRFVPGGAP
jgi:hypothetical protein